jgi:S-adenosylmethionine:tRNA ribosyltransferase-isomerase
VKTRELLYSLPEGAIAGRPAPGRDEARLLVVGEHGFSHRVVRELPELVPAGALVVLNDTRVRRARLIGRRRPGGGKVELLLLRRLGEGGKSVRFEALGRASRPLTPGTAVDAGPLEAVVLARGAGGLLEVEVRGERNAEAELERSAHVPIPPYLRREDDADDVERYQTVYARHMGSVAAPTAGLHLTAALLEQLRRRAELGALTLHVGAGTFRPVTTEHVEHHPMHAEELVVSDALVRDVARARSRGAPIVAVGTTVVRGLESAADPERPGQVRPFSGTTELLIQPGHRFHVVDALLTNFHQPRSTLLALVAAFAGLERVRAAYALALAEGYRFLSYGDAMWIPRRHA